MSSTTAQAAAADPFTPGRRRPGRANPCGWCGAQLPDETGTGRRRRYCAQACRQRAYERRTAVQRGGLPEDAVVLSTAEFADLQDRLFQLRCAAEDVLTAAEDGATPAELGELAERVREGAKGLERLR
ncbi:hypothetical protein [Actinokineospora cianjurensis]|uniref:Uncharacterized protein n=1 Tax=Actinokineospora cianjurensis TaxID=585224 RepID=A0A421B3X7_9PSEU|nr:hypothetical protein [Actinokineospora cianjurensis]RLK59064.1 hypothetical protein CLV68_3546 [Actinokineospora cianjurensis]